MKYIVYEYIAQFMLTPSTYKRYELKSDKELKDFLFKHQDNLKNIEVFNKSQKCEIKIEINIKN